MPTSEVIPLIPAKRPSDSLVHASSATDPDEAKKAKLNGPGVDLSDAQLARLHLTPEDRNLPEDEFWSKSIRAYLNSFEEEEDPDPCLGLRKNLPETLPEGCIWGSYNPGSGIRSYVVKMFCLYCGAAHLSENCPKKDTPEAAEFRRRNIPDIFSDSSDGTEPPKTK